ncbi:hypothetical protein OIE66_02800 [Nonomuraea sp. NBC_01738]|uniref:hypothetical protein n=1 Tax=Nonomuraea sp. NBC_01738 TaxID=2976003 RepID=UPI002E13F8B1|nr:hypothetical protein OIE66_02800 [Nonomuraea sp. NBC_01738]
MSRLGPVITLAAGVVLAAGLGVASITAAPAAEQTAAITTSAPAPTDAPEPTASATKSTPLAVIERADYATRLGNGALLAISIRDGKAIAYFCDGRTEAWFKGKAAAGEVSAKGFGDATVTARLGGGKAAGTLKLSGKSWKFAAPVVKKPSGLYRATALVRGARIKASWIVLRRPDGNGFYQVGLAFEDESAVAVPPLDPAAPTTPVTLGDATLYPQEVEEIS